jgi:3-isopropylmalate/(R)-2-methylmalate dehydratase small subunit
MAMDAMNSRIARIVGAGMALRGNDIDTDQILPARFLTSITFEGLEAHVFADSAVKRAPADNIHPFFAPRFADSSVLVVNANFGCGSSREHAPQALYRWGIRAVIGESFGEIFAGNSIAIGLPCVEVAAHAAASLQARIEETPVALLELDLTAKSIRMLDQEFPFHIAEGRRRQFMEGTWDATSVLLAAGAR